MGLVNEVVPDGSALERALAMAHGIAEFPQATMLADRRAALEAQAGPQVFADAVQGAGRFAGGEGRGGAGAGV